MFLLVADGGSSLSALGCTAWDGFLGLQFTCKIFVLHGLLIQVDDRGGHDQLQGEILKVMLAIFRATWVFLLMWSSQLVARHMTCTSRILVSVWGNCFPAACFILVTKHEIAVD